MRKIISGIYEIRNKINNKYYVGSSCNIYSRWAEHIRMLKRSKHHSILLQRAWAKYGEENFEFNIIVAVDERFLLEEEQKYLDKNVDGYNIAKDAVAWMKGRKHSKETLEKMSKAAKGNKSCTGMSTFWKDKDALSEHLAKIRKMRKFGPETRKKLSESLKGRKAWNKGIYNPICKHGHQKTENSKGKLICKECNRIKTQKRRDQEIELKQINKENN